MQPTNRDAERELRTARITEDRTRMAITDGIEQIAWRLEQAAAELRRELAGEQTSPVEQAQQAQQTVAWVVPYLDVHGLSREADAWTDALRDIERLEPATESRSNSTTN